MINVAIVGYGNLGRGVRSALEKNGDMKFTTLFTRRPEQLSKEFNDVPVLSSEKIALPKDLKIDVAILCGGSKEDTPVQGPVFAHLFNTVDSYDNHSNIPGHYQKMNDIAGKNGHVSIISTGWDPGIYSLERVLGDAFLPGSKNYTFWGTGVSQGHSDAARKVKGVIDARQYTIPVDSALQKVRAGQTPEFTKKEMHKRVVYVVAEEGADRNKIAKEIITMPAYYADYITEVNFITKEEMAKNHAALPHGGFVLTSGITGENTRQITEYRCQLQSNPEFTGSVLVACARAAFRLQQQGSKGAFTMLDIPPALLSPHSAVELRSYFM
ncbi:MAG: diaminopimelate dehydrogenase [Dehalococcoidales bacterium]|nr:diaminopimelate dehydrogenase [Dehalococcoidales bacterium]